MRLRRGFKGFFKKWKKELNLDIESKLGGDVLESEVCKILI